MNLNKNSKLPLLFLIIISCILAVPAGVGTFIILSEEFRSGFDDLRIPNYIILFISAYGYSLLISYFAAYFFNNHSKLMWILSLTYNTCFSLFYLCSVLFLISKINLKNIFEIIYAVIPVTLILTWTIIASLISYYYLKKYNPESKEQLP